jgi:hypothetical protein
VYKRQENNTIIKTSFAKTGESFSFGTVDIAGKKDGDYNYAILLCNKSGNEKCTKSNTITMTVK